MLRRLREQGITDIEVLSDDNERITRELAAPLGVAYQANFLPEDKICMAKDYQANRQTGSW